MSQTFDASAKAMCDRASDRLYTVPNLHFHLEASLTPQSISNQDLSLPSLIGSCSNTSGNESLTFLLNAFMANTPQGPEQIPHDQNQHHQQQPQYHQEQNQQQHIDQKSIIIPSEFYQHTQAGIIQPQDESNSSLSTFIRNLTAGAQVFTTDTPVEIVNLDDSMQQKICQEMMRPPGNSSMDAPMHQVYNVIPNLESNTPSTSNNVPPPVASTTSNPLISPQIHGDDTLEYLQNQSASVSISFLESLSKVALLLLEERLKLFEGDRQLSDRRML
ncbi:hypothetical protein ACTXT7_005750 [Hymenolepis weldensis]